MLPAIVLPSTNELNMNSHILLGSNAICRYLILTKANNTINDNELIKFEEILEMEETLLQSSLAILRDAMNMGIEFPLDDAPYSGILFNTFCNTILSLWLYIDLY